jgi:hypothetical protein
MFLPGGSTQNKNRIKDIGLDKQNLNTPCLSHFFHSLGVTENNRNDSDHLIWAVRLFDCCSLLIVGEKNRTGVLVRNSSLSQLVYRYKTNRISFRIAPEPERMSKVFSTDCA